MSEEILSPAEILQEKIKQENDAMLKLSTTLHTQLENLKNSIEKNTIKLDVIKSNIKTSDSDFLEKSQKITNLEDLIKLLLSKVDEIEKQTALKTKENSDSVIRAEKLREETKAFGEDRAKAAKVLDDLNKEIDKANKKLANVMKDIEDVEEYKNKKEFYNTLTETLTKIVGENKDNL